MLRSRVFFVLLWFVAAMCGLVPYLVALHTSPIPTFYSEFATGWCWVALAVAVLALTSGSKTGLPKIALAPLALIGVLFVQLKVAPPLNPFLSLAATFFLLAAAAACGLGARCRNLPGVLEAFAIGVILGGLATVALELLQLFRIPNLPEVLVSSAPLGPDRRMWANMNQPNHVASYLAFGLAACVFIASKSRRVWIGLALVCLTLLLGMSLTFSRITWLHIFVVGGMTGLACGIEQRGRRRWMRVCAPVVLLAVAYQLCNWLVVYANAFWHLDLPTSLGERMQQGTGLRPLLWKHAWHMFLAHPWLGGGWGDYAWNQYVQTDVLGPVEMSMNAHNIVLDQLAKVGLLGLLAVALPLLGFAWSLRKRRMTPELAFLLAVIVVIAVHSMLEYPLHYLFFLLPFAFALGYADERRLLAPSGSMAWASTGAISVCAVAFMAFAWGDYKSIERLQYGTEGMVDLDRYYQHGQTLLVPYGNLVVATRWSVTPALASSLVKLELHAAQFYPASNTVQRYALALAYIGKTDDAVVQVRRLHSNYWAAYAYHSSFITQACEEKNELLKRFCARLKAEKLLTGGSSPMKGESSPAPQ